jgi:diguanylate cyclase (GGDEF)-like protein/PAS domain S-box-containing protein
LRPLPRSPRRAIVAGLTLAVLGIVVARGPLPYALTGLGLLAVLAWQLLRMVQDASERWAAQERLHHSEQLLSATGRVARVGGWEVDLATSALTWTEEVYSIHELDPAVRPTVADAIRFYAPEAQPVIQGLVDRMAQTGEGFDVKLPLVTASGRRLWVHAIGQAELRDGKPARLYGTFQDVTERYQAEEQLKLLSERVLLATRAADAGIWDFDMQRQELVWDDGMYRLYGVRREDYPNPLAAWAKVVHPEDRARVEDAHNVAKAGASYEVEFRIVRPGGALRYVKSYVRSERGSDGAVARLIGFNLDVTARRQSEEALRANQTFLTALINNTDDLILATDRDLRITLMNEPLKRAIQHSFGFEIRRGDALERIVIPERREELLHTFERVLAGERQHIESVSRLPNGKVVYQDEAFSPVRDSSGSVTGISIFIHDVTQRRHSEQTIQRIVRATASAVGEQFFRSLVHELAEALQTRYAYVCALVSDTQLRTVAVSGDGAIPENFVYDLDGAPCAEVVRNGIAFFPREVQSRFPRDHFLSELGIQSYLGIAVHTASGRPLGLVAVLHDRPLPESELARGLLSIAAARAGAELERLQIERERKDSEERLRRLVETTHVVPWTFNPREERFTYIGPQIEKIVGYSAEQWCAPGFWHSRLHPDDRAHTERARREQGEDREVEFRFQAADGRWIWLREIISAVPGAAQASDLQGFLLDVTEQKRAAEQLVLAAEVFQSSGEAIVISDAALNIVTVNPAFTAITGYAPQEAVGRTPYELSRGVRSREHDREILDAVQRSGYWQGEVWDRRKSGDSYPKWLTLSAVRDAGGRVANYIEIFSDISERKEREERVRHLAHHDALTGLPNRALLTDRITQAIALAQRNGTRLAVMFLDLDRFKNVNDSLGHSVGDKLLREVAARLLAAMRGSDTVSRLGGDEFVILMPEVSEVSVIAVAARKVLDTVSRPYNIDGHELISTPSMGISVYPGDGPDVETLLRNADAAMYHAKESGRNNYQFFTQDMNARALERLSLERSLRRALEREELRLHYQPQYEVASGKLIGLEALIRWEHPDEGLVSPARFMPFAEETGLILPIGAWVLERACWQNREWQDAGLPPVRISVNISALQFRQPGFADTVRHALRVTGLDARYLELEVTESVIMQDAERVTATLQELKEMGLELAIDDFGTGYSSLSYLKRFPIDRLKIDQSFVRDIPSDGEDAAIISAIIGLTRSLGLRTIAEGVETAEQLTFLRQQGCNEVQGYLLARPMPAADCARLLREGRLAEVLRPARRKRLSIAGGSKG